MEIFRKLGKKRNWQRIDHLLPFLYFIFVFFLYFSLLSNPYFTDEQDVFYGGYNIAKGRDIYASYLCQHMPFSYYFAALMALFGARTIFQYRVGMYLLMSVIWETAFFRHRRVFHHTVMFAIPVLYLAMLKTQFMGTTMIADHQQGVGLILIVLELVRYVDKRVITPSCAVMVSLGIMLSFGTTFIAAYSVFCLFLAVAGIQVWDVIQGRKKGSFSLMKTVREDCRLVAFCLLPFVLLLGWYAVSNNLNHFFDGAYRVNVEVYSGYNGGLGSDPLSIFWKTPISWGKCFLEAVRNPGAKSGQGLLYLGTTVGLVSYCISLGRKSPLAGIMLLLSAIYGGTRGFDGFHAMAYYAVAAAGIALGMGQLMEWKPRMRGIRWGILSVAGIAAVLILSDFVIWAGYNILYPEILLPRIRRSEERILDLLTDPEEEIHATETPVFSLDVMDLELIPQEACDAVSIPWYYDMWGDRQMASIRTMPRVVLYNPEEQTWGRVFREYATEFDSFIRENYTHLPQAEDIWVSNEFLGEASRRLDMAGYGHRVVSAGENPDTVNPKDYFAEQYVRRSFVADGERLKAVRFRAACYHRRSRPTLILRLKEPGTGRAVAEERMTADQIADDFYSRGTLEADLIPGQEYELEIFVERVEGKGDMEFYFSDKNELPLMLEYQE